MHRHVGVGDDLLDHAFDGFGERVRLEESPPAVHQHVQVEEQDGAGVAHAYVVAVPHTCAVARSIGPLARGTSR